MRVAYIIASRGDLLKLKQKYPNNTQLQKQRFYPNVFEDNESCIGWSDDMGDERYGMGLCSEYVKDEYEIKRVDDNNM